MSVVMRFQDDVRDVHHVHHLYSRRQGTAEPPKDIDRSVGPRRPTYEEIGLFIDQCPDVMHNGEHRFVRRSVPWCDAQRGTLLGQPWEVWSCSAELLPTMPWVSCTAG